MIKKVFMISIMLISFLSHSQENTIASPTQDFKPSGSPHFKVFWNYHNGFSDEESQQSAFEIKRVYLGYKYTFSEKFSAKITYDVGKNDAGSNYTAFLKIAQLDWKLHSKIKLSMGIHGNKQFNDQEKVWGYRYIFKSFQDQNKFGSSALVGINAAFTISKKLNANVFINNGEGYKKLQDENGYQRFGANLVYKPFKHVIAKAYVDTHSSIDEGTMTNFSLFAGYHSALWRFGVESNHLSNGKDYRTNQKGYNRNGLSVFAAYAIADTIEIFSRYDSVGSNKLEGESFDWNDINDGKQFIGGIQYKAYKGIKFALNYQGFNYNNSTRIDTSMLYANVEFKF